MISPVNLKISGKHLSSRIKQTIIAMLSVVFGISVYIFMNGLMAGVNEIQDDMAFSALAHIRIYNDIPEDETNLLLASYPEAIHHIRNPKVVKYTDGIKNSSEIIEFVEQVPDVIGVAPQINQSVFYQNGSVERNGTLSGIDIQKEDLLFETSTYVVEGSWDALKTEANGILLGTGLAEILSVRVGNYILVKNSLGVQKSYKVVGLFETSLTNVDNTKAYISINSARQLFSKNAGYVSDIQVNVTHYNNADKVAQSINQIVPFKVESWTVANGQLVAGSDLRNIIALATSFTILIVAGFGIYNIMNMTVNEKIREIAILKAVGYEGRDIVQIFLSQSIIIGVIGGLCGITLGFIVSFIISQVPFQVPGLETLPMTYYPRNYALAFLFGVLTTSFAGYLPARKAAKIDPVEIIRG